MDEKMQKSANTAFLYSYHESAKEYESFILQVKDKYKKKTFYSTVPKKGHNDHEKGEGYMNKKNKEMMKNDIVKLFKEYYSKKDLKKELDGNGDIVYTRNKNIQYGENQLDENNNFKDLNSKKIIIDIIIKNQFDLDKHFFN
jgi:hypothetical protein